MICEPIFKSSTCTGKPEPEIELYFDILALVNLGCTTLGTLINIYSVNIKLFKVTRGLELLQHLHFSTS